MTTPPTVEMMPLVGRPHGSPPPIEMPTYGTDSTPVEMPAFGRPEPPAAQELDLSLLSDTSFETLRAAVQEEWTRRRVVTSAPDEIAAITARADAAAVGRVVWAPITEPAPDA